MKKKFRLKKSTEIEKLVKLRVSWGNKDFTIYKKNTNNETNNFRFCVSVSKKYGNAVERNKMKRRIRAIIKSHESKLEPVDFLVVCRPSSKSLKFNEINKNIAYFLKKLKIYKKNENLKEEKNEK